MVRFGSRVRRTRSGHYELHIEEWERELLRELPAQMRELLATDDPALERLFPPAYTSDDSKNEEYARLTRNDLMDGRLSSLQVMEDTIDAKRLTEEQLVAWMGALNDLRLVLGTRLDVTEDMYEENLPPGDPREPAFHLYMYLGLLQESVVDALSRSL